MKGTLRRNQNETNVIADLEDRSLCGSSRHGDIMALQGIVPQFIGMDRGQMILEQETMWGVATLRVGAVVALATGCFIAFVVTPRPR